MDKNYKWKVLLIVGLLVFSIWKAYPLDKKINLGLDLQGGVQLLLQVDMDKVPEEARKDVTVLLPSLSDYRRILPLTKKGTVVTPPASFMLIVSYNPGYQSALKDLKPSTKQRFIALDFDYPEEKAEVEVVRHESGCPEGLARSLVAAGRKIRGLKTQGLTEGVSTRLLIYAANLIVEGVPKQDAVRSTLVSPLTDDEHMKLSLLDICRGFDLL